MSALAIAAVLAIAPAADLGKLDMVLGKGQEAQAGDIVTVLYRGNLLDGAVFDATDDRPPFVFTLGEKQVIQGWDQGVLGMREGGRRILSIPPELGYGEQDLGDIPPSSTLVFDIQLLKVYKKGQKQEIEVTIQQAGEGREAKEGDTVTVHYTGTFLNGVKFDSSRDRNEPFKIVLGETKLIPGFTQGVIGMRKGERRRVVIPPDLAYGSEGRPPRIPRHSTLVFELELLDLGAPIASP
jgi:FKBP-type peptidyl-prolyl cis-trans isomerase